ncbi:MAG: hypothetical protein ABL892_03725 [Thiobacillaceae bacterium]
MPLRSITLWVAFTAVTLAVSPPLHADVFTSDAVITDPAPEHFSVCFDHGCAAVKIVGMSPAQWRAIKAIFKRLPRTPELERERIRKAVALFEEIAGKLAGTSQDKGGDLVGLGLPGQMDCIDEATNTSLYLTLLKNSGLIKFHEVEDRATRGFLINGWPHNTAVITDTVSGERYAVDSWFLDNGEMPFIVPLDAWRSGWKPEDSERSNPNVISGNR